MKKRLRVLIGTAIGILIAIPIARWGWHLHAQSLKRAQILAELRNLPTVTDYGNGREALIYRGQAQGFHIKLIEWVSAPSKQAVQAQSAGSCVVSYVGSHAPSVSFVQISGHVPHMMSDILGQGFTDAFRPTQISRNHYLYWITQWNTRSPFNASVTRHEYATSLITIRLSSGRFIPIHLHGAG